MTQKNVLLVEGVADRDFFRELCKTLDLSTEIQVAPPKDLGGTHNTKQGVLNHLRGVLLPQIEDGQIQRLAIVVDADYAGAHGLGVAGTLNQIKEIVKPFGFELPENEIFPKGFCFKHSDGLSDFGAWIMPDNTNEGMLEDWIKSCIVRSEQPLFGYAKEAVAGLSARSLQKFKPIHSTKAEVATWLAWQRWPKYGIEYVFSKDELLVDKDSSLYQDLTNWLASIFKNNS